MKQKDSKHLQSSVVSPTQRMAELEWDSLPMNFPQQTSSPSQNSTTNSGMSTSAVVNSEGATYRQTHPNGTKIVGRLAVDLGTPSTKTGRGMEGVISKTTTRGRLGSSFEISKRTKPDIDWTYMLAAFAVVLGLLALVYIAVILVRVG
jgi:hypothetical protein